MADPAARPEVIDFTSLEQRPSRWNTADPAAAVGTLVSLLDKAGVPDQLGASRRLLARSEELQETARAGRATAEQRWQQARAALLAGQVDADGLARVLVELAPWLDSAVEQGRPSLMMGALMDAAAACRGNAVAMVHAEASGIYRLLQDAAGEVVTFTAAVGKVPQQVWATTTTGQASTVAIQAGYGRQWEDLVLAGGRWDAIHSAAELVRDTGSLGSQTMYPAGCPTSIGCMFLGWEAALEGVREVRRLPGPLRVRAAVDRGWRPGLWLADDHARFAAEPKGKRSLLGTLVGR